MSSFNKILKFEWCKAKNNKILVFVGIAVVLTILLFTLVYYCFLNASETDEVIREDVLIEYQFTIDSNNERLAQDNDLSEEDIEGILLRNKELQFYVDTQTIKQDYVNNFEITQSRVVQYSGTSVMILFTAISSIILCGIATVFASYLFCSDYKGNSIKNILAGQVSRIKLLMSKWLIFFGLISCVFLLFFLFAMAFGLTNPSKFLFYINSEFIAVNSMAVFCMQAISSYVLMIVATSITVATGVLAKSSTVAIATAVTVLLLIVLSFFIDFQNAYSSAVILVSSPFKNAPILSLIYNAGHFSVRYIMTLFLHLIASSALIGLTAWRFSKQNL